VKGLRLNKSNKGLEGLIKELKDGLGDVYERVMVVVMDGPYGYI